MRKDSMNSSKDKKNMNMYWISAGLINLFTATLHLIGGQITLVNPLLNTELDKLVKTKWLGAWHMVTVILIVTSFVFLQFGIKGRKDQNKELLKLISYLYILFAITFIVVSSFQWAFAPQSILLFPIGILGLMGIKKEER